MRRGAAYTIVSVILLFVIAALFFTQSRRTGHEVQEAVADRVRNVDVLITSLDEDSRRAAYIAGFRTMIAMEQYITSSGNFLEDPHGAFKEIFLTGNYSGTPFVIMDNSTFEQYLERVQYEARKQGVLFNASVVNITLWQVNPWKVLVNYTLALNVTDVRGTASWKLERTFTGEVPIADLRDPVFSVNTLARVQRVIQPTNVSEFVNDAGNLNDTTGLMEHFNNSYYLAAGRGPDILMRFAGNLSENSPYGIESLIDFTELSDQGLLVNATHSIVDFEYYTGIIADACGIQNTPSYFQLDTSDLIYYEVLGELTYVPC